MILSLDIALPLRSVRSDRTDRVAADFQLADSPPAPLRILEPTTLSLDPRQLAYLVGASGSGKSQVLARLAAAWPGPVVAGALGQPIPRRNIAVLDTFYSLPRRGRAGERD
ncbi:MAG: hypothetical protein PHU85_14220 [Phycisphaerae bacterium]|nr:hypothetical protein [Phycisphaerae bacterium]